MARRIQSKLKKVISVNLSPDIIQLYLAWLDIKSKDLSYNEFRTTTLSRKNNSNTYKEATAHFAKLGLCCFIGSLCWWFTHYYYCESF